METTLDQSLHALSRRRFLAVAGLAAATPRFLSAIDAGLVPNARNSAATSEITVQRLRGNISVLMGSGGNIAVLTGPDGKLLIDAGFAGSQTRLQKALASLSSDPVKRLINTHWHFDHTDGNEWLHAAGATICAHRNTRKHLSETTRVEGWKFTFDPLPAGALPTEVFDTDRAIEMNGTKIALKRYEPAHTDSDISVHFASADILHTGDTFWNGAYPFIDYWTGGSLDGMIRATEESLSKVTATTIVIPGHGDIGNRTALIQYRNILIEMRDKVSALKRQGRTLSEVIATKPGAAYDAKWGASFMSPADFAGLVYRGV